MARLLMIISVVLATAFYTYADSASASASGSASVTADVQGIATNAQTVLKAASGVLAQKVDALDDGLKITELTNLIKGILGQLPQILQQVGGLASDLLTSALNNILNAVQSLVGAILNSVKPLLDAVVSAVNDLLNKVGELLNSIVGLLNNLLGGLLGNILTNLTSLLQNVLGQVKQLGSALVDTLTATLDKELTTIFDSIKTIANFVTGTLIPKVLATAVDTVKSVVDLLGRLLQVDSLVNQLLGSILSPVFALVGQLKNILEGLLSGILPSLTGALGKAGSCNCQGLLGRRRRALE